MSQNQTLLITGASGKLGRLVLDGLLRDNTKNKITAATQTRENLLSYIQKGVEVRAADFTDKASLTMAFQGVKRFLLISTDAAGSRLGQHKNAIQAYSSFDLSYGAGDLEKTSDAVKKLSRHSPEDFRDFIEIKYGK